MEEIAVVGIGGFVVFGEGEGAFAVFLGEVEVAEVGGGGVGGYPH